MAWIEDAMTGGVGVAVAVGATALAVPVIAPHLSPPVRSAMKGVLSLVLEAESSAEGGIIQKLADSALSRALDALSGAGSEQPRRAAAREVVRHYRHHAERRAGRYAADEQDRQARYRRHEHGLRRAVATARRRGADPDALREIEQAIDGTG